MFCVFSSSPVSHFVCPGVHLSLWGANALLAFKAETAGHLFSASLRFCFLMASHLEWCMEHQIIALPPWEGGCRIDI